MDAVNNCTKVLDFLYLGDLDNSLDKVLLDEENITHIVSVLDGSKRKYSHIKYHIIDIKDYPWLNISKYFHKAINFIHNARVKNQGVLVHCGMGISRSVTIIIAYLMVATNLPWQQILAAIQCVRPEAGPNSGFLRQLGEFQDSVKSETSENFTDYELRNSDIRTLRYLYSQKNVNPCAHYDTLSKITRRVTAVVGNKGANSGGDDDDDENEDG